MKSPAWLKKLLLLVRPASSAKKPAVKREERQIPARSTDVSYSSDQPIRSRDEDRFSRWPFAKRIADTLAARADSSSLVVGLYARWGEGKSSTLLMMEQELKTHAHVVCLHFDPWHFETEEQLIRGFFAILAGALGKSLPTMKEKLGNLLERYGSVLSGASLSVEGGVDIDVGDAATGLGAAISFVDLHELRERVDGILRTADRRVVVLIDDIDRLDRTEIQAVFRLIKLSAGFTNVSYVVAFDEEEVSASLGEKHGIGDTASGRRFLEKIVQVPLSLPPAEQMELRGLALEGVDQALRASRIELTKQQAEAFVRHFIDGIEPRIRTPRQAKLYGNALLFALPILKGEVNPVDLMLIEGVRIFYPHLYETIRHDPGFFLVNRDGMRNEVFSTRVKQAIERAFAADAVAEQEAVRHGLLEVLFPRLKGVFGKTFYEQEANAAWEREQRICTDAYFHRYFRYGIPPGDVADLDVGALLDVASERNDAKCDSCLSELHGRSAIRRLIPKLRRLEDGLDKETAHNLALAIARNGAILPPDGGLLASEHTNMQAGILVSNLIGRDTNQQSRDEIALKIADVATPLPFAMQCLRWMRKGKETRDADRLLSEKGELSLGRRIAERIREEAAKGPLHKTYGPDSSSLLWLWNEHAPVGEVSNYLSSQLSDKPDDAEEFLAVFAGQAVSMESGLSVRAGLRRESYDAIVRLIDPAVILVVLRARYGSELDAPDFYLSEDVPYGRQLAHQFAHIHAVVVREAKSTGRVNTPEKRDSRE